MTQKEIIEAKEHNYKLYNDAIRKDLDIIMTSTIPTQKNLMKTLLWINATMLGFVFTVLNTDIIELIKLLLAIPFTFSFLAVLSILFSLKDGRIKSFGAPDIDYIKKIEINEWMKLVALDNVNGAYKSAFDDNAKVVKTRASKMAFATNLTIESVVSMGVIIIVLASKNL